MEKVWIVKDSDGYIHGVYNSEFKAKKELIQLEEEGKIFYDPTNNMWVNSDCPMVCMIIIEFDVK